MRWLLVALAVAGCAKAGPGNSIIGGADAGPDGLVGVTDIDAADPDASLIDAPARVTLTQTVTEVITENNSLSCEPDPLATQANSYYRVFTLEDHGVPTTLHVTEVTFAIEHAFSGTGPDQPATLNVGTYGVVPSGTSLDVDQIRPITSVPIRIRDGDLTTMTVPVTADVPATTNLVVELAIPADDTVLNRFFIGSNQAGERAPGYLRAKSCDYIVPTSFQQVADDTRKPPVDIILTVTGTM